MVLPSKVVGSIVAFEDDLLSFPTQALQGIAVSRHHLIQPADIGVNVVHGALYQPRIRPVKTRMLRGYLTHVFLHIATSSRPSLRRSAQRLLIEEIRPAGSNPLKIILVIKLRLIARSIHQPDLPTLASIFAIVGEEVLDKASHRCDARTRRDEDAVGQRRDRKSTRLNSSHSQISYAVFCLK